MTDHSSILLCKGGDIQEKGLKKKINMLKKEGIEIRDGKIVNFEKVLFRFR